VLTAVLVSLAVLGLYGCRFMPFEVGARILPKSLAKWFYGETAPKNPKPVAHPHSN
jgi:hypothetical protein